MNKNTTTSIEQLQNFLIFHLSTPRSKAFVLTPDPLPLTPHNHIRSSAKSRIWTRLSNFLACTLAILCLAAVGSDGIYFPWPNIAGLAGLFLFAVMANKGSGIRVQGKKV
jgi:hypothetical protein